MRILMISEFFPPVNGGLERHVYNLSEYINSIESYEVIVVTLGWNGIEKYKKMSYKVIYIEGLLQKLNKIYVDKNKKFHPPFADPLIFIKILNIVKKYNPDIIHCHGWILYTLLKVKKLINKPLIVTLHDYGFICPQRTMLMNYSICEKPGLLKCFKCLLPKTNIFKNCILTFSVITKKKKMNKVDKFLAVSNCVKNKYLNNLNLNKQKISVVPNFYVNNKYLKEKANLKDVPDDFILFVGRLSTHKGVDVLINAYNQLQVNTKLLLIGSKEQNFNLINKNKNIIIWDNQPNDIVMEVWQSCRFGVVPSKWPDPCPTVALEAMACNKALIASNLGGLKDIVIHKKTGILVSPDNEDDLAKAINLLIDNPKMTDAMGREGKKRLENKFTLKKVVGSIKNEYKKIKIGE